MLLLSAVVLRLISSQNFALNVAENGFDIAVYNRSYEKTEACVKRAEKEGEMPIHALLRLLVHIQ